MADDVFKIIGTTQGGSFHVERVVAEGGFSVVYRALHGAFRAPVALKCLKVPDDLTAAQRKDYLERFREEAELLFRLSARIPEVVRPLHVDKLTLKDGRFAPFLALEWLDGEALASAVARRAKSGQAPMGLVKLAKLLTPIAQAISRAHRFPGPSGRVAIIHCDLKPENVFITKIDGSEGARILDYGIAMAMRSAGRKAAAASAQESAEAAYFTPGYAAPEQWSPRRFGQPGPKTDVWGLALTLVEAMTAAQPLGHGGEASIKAAALDLTKRPTPRALGAVVPDAVEAAFARALAVHPNDRTPDIATFWSEFEQALGLPLTFLRRDDRSDPDAPSTPISSDPVSPSPVALVVPAAAIPTAAAPSPAPVIPTAPPAAIVRPSNAPELDLSLEEPFFDGRLTGPKPPRSASVRGVSSSPPSRAAAEVRISEAPQPRASAAPASRGEAKELDLELPDDMGLEGFAPADSIGGELELAPSTRGSTPPVSVRKQQQATESPLASVGNERSDARGASARPARPTASPHSQPPRAAEKAPAAAEPARNGAAEEQGPSARAPMPSDVGPLDFELSRDDAEEEGAARAAPIAAHVMPPLRTATPRAFSETRKQAPSLRLPIQLMASGAAIAVLAVATGESVEAIHALGSFPKFGGIALFVAGLLLLFWRLFEG